MGPPGSRATLCAAAGRVRAQGARRGPVAEALAHFRHGRDAHRHDRHPALLAPGNHDRAFDPVRNRHNELSNRDALTARPRLAPSGAAAMRPYGEPVAARTTPSSAAAMALAAASLAPASPCRFASQAGSL